MALPPNGLTEFLEGTPEQMFKTLSEIGCLTPHGQIERQAVLEVIEGAIQEHNSFPPVPGPTQTDYIARALVASPYLNRRGHGLYHMSGYMREYPNSSDPTDSPTHENKEKKMNCPVCQEPTQFGAPFCDNCGANLASLGPSPKDKQATHEASGAIHCSQCGASAVAGQIFCENCGKSLADLGHIEPTKHEAPPPVQAPKLIVLNSGNVLEFGGKTEVLIGREDARGGIYPEIDMTSHGGREGGVSRQHAKISKQYNQWEIQDMGSVNYTYVNKKRLTPGYPHPLNKGDEIRLGGVVLRFEI